MYKNKSNPALSMQTDNLLNEQGECQKYVSILYKQHRAAFFDNKKAKPQDVADTLGVNAGKVLKVQEIVAKALNDIAAAVGDDSLKVDDALPAGVSYTTNPDGTVKVTVPDKQPSLPPAGQPQDAQKPLPGTPGGLPAVPGQPGKQA